MPNAIHVCIGEQIERRGEKKKQKIKGGGEIGFSDLMTGGVLC